MIKRPIDRRFRGKIADLVKVTTIRDKPWPVGRSIMLYHWTGRAYRSKQEEFLPVVVLATERIQITRTVLGMGYWKDGSDDFLAGLWITEGFESQEEMDAWFRPLVKCGETITKHLMRFRLAEGGAE